MQLHRDTTVGALTVQASLEEGQKNIHVPSNRGSLEMHSTECCEVQRPRTSRKLGGIPNCVFNFRNIYR